MNLIMNSILYYVQMVVAKREMNSCCIFKTVEHQHFSLTTPMLRYISTKFQIFVYDFLPPLKHLKYSQINLGKM